MDDRAPSFPDLDEREIDELLEAIRGARDEYAKMDAMEPYVSWGERRQLLWELTRSGALDTWNQPALWSELANGLAWASSEDVVSLLNRIDSYDSEHRESARLIEEWPTSLDELAMRAYADDPEPFDAEWREFGSPVRRGFELVLRRFGVLEPEELSFDAVDALARQHARDGLPMQVWTVRDGELEEVELHDHTGPTPELYDFIELFGSREEWSRRLLEHSLEIDFGPPYKRSYDAWRVADIDELETLLATADIQPFERPGVYRLLVEERDEEPEELVELARRLSGDGYSGLEAEICVVAAILKWKARDESLPEEIENLLTFKSVGRPARLQDYYGLNRLIEAVRHLPEERLVDRMRELFQQRVSRLAPFAVLRAVSENEEVLEMAFDAAREASQKEGSDFASMHPVAYGLALAGPDVLEEVESAYEQAENPLLRDTYHRAIVHLLADRAKAGHGVPEEYDRFISFVDWESPETDDYNFGHFILEDLLAIVANMPEARVLELIEEELGAESSHWPRVLEALQHYPDDGLLEQAFDRLDREGVPSGGGSFNWVERFLQSLPETNHGELGSALAASSAPELHNSAKRVFGDDRYEDFLAEHDAQSSADPSVPEKVRRLAEQIFESATSSDRRTLYFLERTGEPPSDEDYNRVGGAPVGVSLSDWPHREQDESSPMEHMVTVDIETVPELDDRVDSGTRALALFVYNPQYNEAWTPFSADAEVLQLDESDLAEGSPSGSLPAGSTEEVEGFEVTSVEVPVDIFENPYAREPEERDPLVEELRDTVYQASARAGGAPIWLQEDQAPSSNFLFQFDEQFISMNLGDMGVMYVFAETAFWQCH